MRVRLTLAALLVAAAVLSASATGAWAHPVAEVAVVEDEPVPDAPAPAPAVSPAESPAAAPVPLVVGLVLALAVAAAAPRRALAVALVLVLSVLAVEVGVHSVHHLGDRQAAAQCDVASASTHVHGATPQAPSCSPWVPTLLGAVLTPESGQPGARLIRPDEGRAPPAA